MATIPEARLQLLAALRTVEGLRVYGDPGATIDPPAAIVGIPAVGWRAFCPAPTSARWVLLLAVRMDDRATERLSQLLGPVVEAVETEMKAAAVQDGPSAALPATLHSGGVELAAWEITVEVDL
jgi:hypothetical protein